RLGAREFFISYLTTALRPDELLVEVRFPAHERHGTAFLEVARRHGDYALVGVGALVTLAGDLCAQARLAFTGVGPVRGRMPGAEAVVPGKAVTDGHLAQIQSVL